jgi:hypothetical protein
LENSGSGLNPSNIFDTRGASQRLRTPLQSTEKSVSTVANAFGNALGNSLAGLGSQSDDGQKAGRVAKPISREQAERNMYGGMTSSQLLGGDKDWLAALGAYDGSYETSGNDERIPTYQAAIPQVIVDGGDVNQRLNAIFGLTPKNIGSVQVQSTQIDSLATAAAADRRFYTASESGASNGYSAAAWHIGGLLNEVGYDLAKTARGAFQLVTDSNTQAAAYNALKFAANNPGLIADNAIQGFKNFANKPFGQQADSVFKFAAGGFATAGTGKLGMLAVDGAVTGAKTTARWVAPKVGDLVENYMYRTGGLAYMDKPVPTWNAPTNWQGPALSRGSWAGEVGNSEFILTNATAESVGVALGSAVRFINGAPYFGSYALLTPAGSPGSFSVKGLIYEHAADARTTIRHLANEAGMTPAEVISWLAAQDVRMHHFEGNTMQLVPTSLHTGIHYTGSRGLNGR